MFWGLGVLGGVHLWVGHCCLSLAGGVFGVLGGVQLGVVCLLPFFWAVCSVGGAGRGAVWGRSPAAFFWLFVLFGVVGRVQLGVGHLLLCCVRGCG